MNKARTDTPAVRAESVALARRGNALLGAGNAQGALDCYAQALRADAHNIDAIVNAGSALLALGRPHDAIARYDEALRLRPGFAAVFVNRANVWLALQEPARALADYESALRLQPAMAPTLQGCGDALRELRRPAQAHAYYGRALALNPHDAGLHVNRGNALHDEGRLDEALAAYGEALRLDPMHTQALLNHGNTLVALGRPFEALANYERVLGPHPDDAEANVNYGQALQAVGRTHEAKARCEKVLGLKPGDAVANFNLALCELQLGEWAAGFARYESRFANPRIHPNPRTFAQPRWDGSQPLAGRTLLLYAEQGLGDTLQFCRYARLAAARGARVVLEVQRPLVTLLAGLDGVVQAVAFGDALPSFDLQCPLMSLPRVFGTRPDTVPASTAYLHADADRVAQWRTRLGPARGPRIGLVWSGNPGHANDRNRSIAFADIARLLDIGGAQYVSLQKEVREADRPALAARPDIAHFGGALRDFADTAALVCCMDLVISVDSSVAHLAGALGRPVWLLLPFNPDWRWLLGRGDTPWYAAMRLFRQRAAGDWDGVLREVGEGVAGLG